MKRFHVSATKRGASAHSNLHVLANDPREADRKARAAGYDPGSTTPHEVTEYAQRFADVTL
jgi:tRNA G18 (ribose-2'-O)-methylase SpoU